MATLELTGIRKIYGATDAVRHASQSIAGRKLVCLPVPSGSGKSTLLRLIGGADVTRRPPDNRPTAMVFQSHALGSHMTGAQNIAFGLKLHCLSRAAIREKVEGALGLVGHSGFGDCSVTRLCGGQQQHGAIARCLVLEPEILLLDEPFAALDQRPRERLRDEVRAIQQALGITTVFVTHGQEEALAIADPIVVMSMGRVNQVGAQVEIDDAPADPLVAGFIGAMNMAQVQGGRLALGGMTLAVPAPDGPVRITIRPEHLVLRAGQDARVTRAMHFGAFQHIDVMAGEGPLRLQAGPAAKVAPGDPVGLVVDRLTLFRDGRVLWRGRP